MIQEQKLTVGLAFTGSFCTFAKIREVAAQLAGQKMRVIPIYSDHVQQMDTRFGTAEAFQKDIEEITGETGIRTIQEAEPIGPDGYLDYCAVYREYDGKTVCRHYGYACSDGGKSTFA